MIKIHTGKYKGLVLPTPNPVVTRPTSDKVRQAVFNILHHNILKTPWDQLNVLDAFCGTGSLGLQALSLGAKSCTFIDENKTNISQLKNVAKKLNMQANCIQGNFFKTQHPQKNYDLVFIDPPFQLDLWQSALNHLIENQVLQDGCIVYIESEKDLLLNTNNYFDEILVRNYGRIQTTFLQFICPLNVA
jgi:16S rRNA (guanine966-N2)-methyltransferase